jgi:hypothetical protein
VLVAEANKDVALGSGSPPGKLVSVGNCFVERVGMTEGRVEILEALAGVLCFRKQIIRAEAGQRIRDKVV